MAFVIEPARRPSLGAPDRADEFEGWIRERASPYAQPRQIPTTWGMCLKLCEGALHAQTRHDSSGLSVALTRGARLLRSPVAPGCTASRLVILPDTTHVTLMMRASIILPIVIDFLDVKR
jgi:hypothetical protein